MPMQNTIISLTNKLVTIRSTPDNKKALTEALDMVTEQLKDFTIERFERDGVKSVLIYNVLKRPKKFRVILNGHLDIIPGKDFQYKPVLKNGRLYGVATVDMKAS